MELSPKLANYIRPDGVLTGGYVVRDKNGTPVYCGTFSECVERVGAFGGTIRDARGLSIH